MAGRMNKGGIRMFAVLIFLAVAVFVLAIAPAFPDTDWGRVLELLWEGIMKNY